MYQPENILLAGGKPPHQAKIADFGLSKFFNTASDELMKTMIGTPQFVAPELVKNEEYGSEVDLWACGIITYNMLTGEIPFTEKSVLELYRKGDVKIQYGSEWKRISSKAQSLTRMLLCVNPSTRINAIGALHHRWFTDSEEEDSETDYAQKRKQSRMDYARSRVGERSKVSLERVRQCVHGVRFLQRLLAKAGNGKFFKIKATVLSDYPKQESRISVGTTEDSEWDFIVQDVSVGQMDSIPLSPPTSPRNATRKQTLATRQSDASMISLVTPQAADGSPQANFDEVLNIPSPVPMSKNNPSHQINSPSISQSSYGDRSRSTANQKSHGIGRNPSPGGGVHKDNNMHIYRSNTAVVAGSVKERALDCERHRSHKPSSVYSARGCENAKVRQKMRSEIRMSSTHDTPVHEHANSDLFTPSVLPLNEENMWLSADAVDPSDSIHYSNTYNEGGAMNSNSVSQADRDERAVNDTRARRRSKVKEMTRRLLGGLRMGRKNKEHPSENSS